MFVYINQLTVPRFKELLTNKSYVQVDLRVATGSQEKITYKYAYTLNLVASC